MLKKFSFVAGYALLVASGCVNTNNVSNKGLLGEHQALIKGQASKGFASFLTRNGVGRHAEVNIVAIDGKTVSGKENNQVIVLAGEREIKALCNLHFVAVDAMTGTTAVNKETVEKVSNEVVYLLKAEAGGRYQLISNQDEFGNCVVSAERYDIFCPRCVTNGALK